MQCDAQLINQTKQSTKPIKSIKQLNNVNEAEAQEEDGGIKGRSGLAKRPPPPPPPSRKEATRAFAFCRATTARGMTCTFSVAAPSFSSKRKTLAHAPRENAQEAKAHLSIAHVVVQALRQIAQSRSRVPQARRHFRGTERSDRGLEARQRTAADVMQVVHDMDGDLEFLRDELVEELGDLVAQESDLSVEETAQRR
eukprot:scaffold30_cov166-Ochromonas_danica.AAC.2